MFRSLFWKTSRHKVRRSKAKQNRRRLVVEPLEPRIVLSLTVPAYSSMPGADHTIFLDFDGHVTENTTWNSAYGVSSIVSPAYDIDGDSNNFNSTELTRISNAWERVAEDFSPFKINVTTVDPGSDALRYTGGGDTQWGVRVVITDDTFANCGCGGHAYIGSFDDFYDEPVFVYNTSETGVSEASSHEAGHALNLSHDGTSSSAYYWGHGSGATSWAPLMGASYNRSVTQWSKGEYFDANNAGSGANYGNGPDDLAVITSLTNGNGFGFRPDDHGDSNAAASALAISGTSANGSGIIETTNDVDVYSFTTGTGNVTLNIDPAQLGANLDIRAELYDAGNNLVAVSDPSNTLDASLNLSLSQGQYYLHVDGVGTGNPLSSTPTGYTEYGSLGQYSISGTIVDPGGAPQISINDVAVNEGDGTATFTVSLGGSITEVTTIDYTTANGSANAGSDYVATSGTLTFNPGDSVKSIAVPITDDSVTENAETFFVNLSNASSGVIIADGQGQGTINDNDTDISINDVSGSEGNLAKGKKNAGNPSYKDFVFTVSLSNSVGQTVIVDFGTADGTATTSNIDYQSTSGTIIFSPGQTSKTITVTVVGDNDQETDETFFVQLSNSQGGNVVDSEGIGTIVDDDTKSGGKGGGKGGGPKKIPGEDSAIEARDAIWMFEGPNQEYDGQHGLVADHFPAESVGMESTPTFVGFLYNPRRADESNRFGFAASVDQFNNTRQEANDESLKQSPHADAQPLVFDFGIGQQLSTIGGPDESDETSNRLDIESFELVSEKLVDLGVDLLEES